MPWLMLVLSLAAFCFAWSVHSPAWMILGLLVGLAGLGGFAWMRYRLLFPDRSIAIDDTPMSADDIRRMREAQIAGTAASPAPLPAASHPDASQLRAAAQRVAEREALEQQHADAQRRIAEMERRATEAEQRAAEMAQRLTELQQREAQAQPAVASISPAPESAESEPATPPALPRPAVPLPNLRDEGWNPYAGVVTAPPKRAIDPKAAGLDVPMLTPLRDDAEPT